MNFIDFATEHGLIISTFIADGTWRRCKTVDHPNKTNGAYIFDGIRGAIQNWAKHEKPIPFRSDKVPDIHYRNLVEKNKQDEKEKQEKAAKKAGYILHNSKMENHSYLEYKGFPELKGLVFEENLIIPMRIDKKIVGLQKIDEFGNKKFLYGQVTNYSTHEIGNRWPNFYVEGYASGLSVQKALKQAGLSYRVIVCFSAQNMLKVARKNKTGYVIADNDKSLTGERVAKEIGLPYWISDIEGEDFNDASRRLSSFELSQQLKRMILKIN